MGSVEPVAACLRAMCVVVGVLAAKISIVLDCNFFFADIRDSESVHSIRGLTTEEHYSFGLASGPVQSSHYHADIYSTIRASATGTGSAYIHLFHRQRAIHRCLFCHGCTSGL